MYATLPRGRLVHVDHGANTLTPGSALIEYVVFQTVDFQAQGTQPSWQAYRYVAFVLPAGVTAQPQLVDLGEAEAIDGIARVIRRHMSQAPDLILRMGEEAAEQRFREAAERFYRATFAPLIPALGGRTVLYAVPDGGLNLVPFEAAHDGQGRYLIETYSINYLSSGRDALALNACQSSGPAVVVLADPDYDAAEDSH